MPIREKNTERIAGLFILIGLLALGGLIFQFGRFDDKFQGNYELFVEFSDTAGIIQNSEVRLRGVKVGKVATEPELHMRENRGYVLMKMSLQSQVKIPKGSTLRVSSSGFIGDKFIEITPAQTTTGEVYQPGQTIIGTSTGGLDAIANDAQDIIKDTREVMQEVTTSIDKLNASLDSITTATQNIDRTITRVNDDFLTKQNASELSAILTNFRAASAELSPTITTARETLTSIQKSTEQALSNVPDAVKSIDQAAAKASKTIDALQNKDGLLGTLTQDTEASSDAKDFIKNIKRYGILRYRDDKSPETTDPRNKFRGSRR